MMNKTIFITAILTIYSFISMAQIAVMPVNEGNSTSGVMYALPRTVIHIELEVERQEFFPGPLNKYAEEFIGIRAESSSHSKYSIKGTSISTSSEPDPEQFYFVEFNPNDMRKSNSMLLSFDENGGLSSVNLGNNQSRKQNLKKNILDQASIDPSDLFDYQSITEVKEIVDTTIRRINVDTTVVNELIINKKRVKQSEKEKAQEAARLMSQLAKDRYALSTGYQEVNYDAEALAYMDKRLKEQYDDYEALFLGKYVTYTEYHYFDYVPSKNKKNGKDIIFGFSDKSGVTKSVGSNPIYISINSENTTQNVINKVTKLSESKIKKGFYYRIPEMATIEIHHNNKTLHHLRIPINQFGVTTYAPNSKNLGVELNPKSGYIKQIMLKYED